MFRQAVISIHKATPSGEYRPIADKDILFRQPFNNFGLALSFNFEKAIFTPASDCQISIVNPDDSIPDSLKFEYSLPRTRPKIRIYAGQSDFKPLAFNTANIIQLKSSLQEIYTGYPMYYSDDKLVGSRLLSISLTDISLIGAKERITTSFSAKTSITNIMESLLTSITEFDIAALKNDIDFSLLTIEDDLIFNNRLLIEDVIQDLESDYFFSHYIDQAGVLVFFPRDLKDNASGASKLISHQNGLIGQANTINWTDIAFQTHFAEPDIFYPGQSVEVKAPNLNPIQNTKGRIINASYNFDDSNGDISYVMNQFGQAVSSMPILKL